MTRQDFSVDRRPKRSADYRRRKDETRKPVSAMTRQDFSVDRRPKRSADYRRRKDETRKPVPTCEVGEALQIADQLATGKPTSMYINQYTCGQLIRNL
jgi:hypothetical protein